MFISAAKTDPDSGLVATLSSSADHFTRTGGADFRLVVDNPNDTERVWDSSPGPRFDLLRADGTSAWTDGCQTAYPAIVTSEAIAPGAHVDLAAHYPRAWDDQYAESCAAEPGTYSLSAKFAWCPTYQDRQEGQPPRRSLRCTSEKLVSMPPVQVVVTS